MMIEINYMAKDTKISVDFSFAEMHFVERRGKFGTGYFLKGRLVGV